MDSQNDDSLKSRPPALEDLLELCRQLNHKKVKYIIIGGIAVIQHGFIRATEDINLLIDDSKKNKKKIREALLYLPDQSIKEVNPGDIQNYGVVRVADEIIIDLMKSACGITFKEASQSITVVEIRGVKIPFASLELLLKLKQSQREKDVIDRTFIEEKLKLIFK